MTCRYCKKDTHISNECPDATALYKAIMDAVYTKDGETLNPKNAGWDKE